MPTSTVILIVIGLLVAAFGAWDTTRTRHHMTTQHRRRKTDQ